MARLELKRGDVVNENTGIKYLEDAGVDEYHYRDYRAAPTAAPTRHIKRRCLFECPCGGYFIARLSNVRRGDRKSCGCMPRGRAALKARALAENKEKV